MPVTMRLLILLGLAFPAALSAKPSVIPKDYDLLQAATSAGNAEIYEGGDLFLQRLVAAREKINQALKLVRGGHELEGLCRADRCGAEARSPLCHALQTITEAQRAECRAFLRDRAAEITRLNTDTLSPLSVSSMPLTVKGPNGTFISVNAMTQRGERRPIIFHYARAAALTEAELMALLGHELGHKVDWMGAPIEDNRPVGSFRSGRLFLDAVGAALGLYASQNSVPSQAPPAIPAAIAESAACRLLASPAARTIAMASVTGGAIPTASGNTAPASSAARDGARAYLLGLLVDTEGALPSEDRMERLAARYEALAATGAEAARLAVSQAVVQDTSARRETVRRLFLKLLLREPTADETQLMLERLAEGIPFDAILASIQGDSEYMATRGARGHDQFVTSLYLDLLGRAPTPNEVKAQMHRLRIADPASVAQMIFRGTPEAWTHLVEGWYREYLNRAPSTAERDVQVNRLRAGSSWEAVRALILSEREYAALQSVRWKPCAPPAAQKASGR